MLLGLPYTQSPAQSPDGMGGAEGGDGTTPVPIEQRGPELTFAETGQGKTFIFAKNNTFIQMDGDIIQTFQLRWVDWECSCGSWPPGRWQLQVLCMPLRCNGRVIWRIVGLLAEKRLIRLTPESARDYFQEQFHFTSFLLIIGFLKNCSK